MRTLLKIAVAAAVLLVASLPASADSATFTGYSCTSSNSPACPSFAAGVSVTVFWNETQQGVTASSTQIGFLFSHTNVVGSIETLGFADPGNLIVGPASVTNFTGTNFSGPGCSPSGGVPDGLQGGFTFENQLCSDRSGGAAGNLHAGEYVAVVFSLTSGVTYQDVINAIANGTFAIGHHVQQLPDGQSDVIICSGNNGCAPPPPCTVTNECTPPTVVPEPASLALFGTGMVSIAGLVRRRMRR